MPKSFVLLFVFVLCPSYESYDYEVLSGTSDKYYKQQKQQIVFHQITHCIIWQVIFTTLFVDVQFHEELDELEAERFFLDFFFDDFSLAVSDCDSSSILSLSFFERFFDLSVGSAEKLKEKRKINVSSIVSILHTQTALIAIAHKPFVFIL